MCVRARDYLKERKRERNNKKLPTITLYYAAAAPEAAKVVSLWLRVRWTGLFHLHSRQPSCAMALSLSLSYKRLPFSLLFLTSERGNSYLFTASSKGESRRRF